MRKDFGGVKQIKGATNADGSGTAVSNTTSTVSSPAAPAPANTVAPAVTGTPTQGQVLTCSQGTWSNSPTSYAYQWRRSGTNISGATASTYTLVFADAGATMSCVVTATNAGGSATATSNSTAAVATTAPVNSAAPAVTGTPTQGQTLSSSQGTWSNTPTSYAYQWRRAGAAISGATSSTYVLVAGDVGNNVDCAVTATNANGSGTATSNAVGPVAAPVAASTFDPAQTSSSLTLSASNTTVASNTGASGWHVSRGSKPSASTPVYFEMLVNARPSPVELGIQSAGVNVDNDPYNDPTAAMYYSGSPGLIFSGSGAQQSGLQPLAAGSVLGVAYHPANATVAFYVNGALQGTLTGVSGVKYPMFAGQNAGSGVTLRTTAASFTQAIPAGFSAWG